MAAAAAAAGADERSSSTLVPPPLMPSSVFSSSSGHKDAVVVVFVSPSVGCYVYREATVVYGLGGDISLLFFEKGDHERGKHNRFIAGIFQVLRVLMEVSLKQKSECHRNKFPAQTMRESWISSKSLFSSQQQ